MDRPNSMAWCSPRLALVTISVSLVAVVLGLAVVARAEGPGPDVLKPAMDKAAAAVKAADLNVAAKRAAATAAAGAYRALSQKGAEADAIILINEPLMQSSDPAVAAKAAAAVNAGIQVKEAKAAAKAAWAQAEREATAAERAAAAARTAETAAKGAWEKAVAKPAK